MSYRHPVASRLAPYIAMALNTVGSIFLKVAGVVADVIGNIFEALGGLIDRC